MRFCGGGRTGIVRRCRGRPTDSETRPVHSLWSARPKRTGLQAEGVASLAGGISGRADLLLPRFQSRRRKTQERSGAGWRRRRSARAASGGANMALAGRPGREPCRCGAWGRQLAHGAETPAQQITFSKDMNWALSLPGACLPEDQSAPGRPILTHLPPLTGSMIWSL